MLKRAFSLGYISIDVELIAADWRTAAVSSHVDTPHISIDAAVVPRSYERSCSDAGIGAGGA